MIVEVWIGLLVVALVGVATYMFVVGVLGMGGARYARCPQCGHLGLRATQAVGGSGCFYCHHDRALRRAHLVRPVDSGAGPAPDPQH